MDALTKAEAKQQLKEGIEKNVAAAKLELQNLKAIYAADPTDIRYVITAGLGVWVKKAIPCPTAPVGSIRGFEFESIGFIGALLTKAQADNLKPRLILSSRRNPIKSKMVEAKAYYENLITVQTGLLRFTK